MRGALVTVTAAALLATMAMAQSPAASPATGPTDKAAASPIPSGGVLVAELAKSLDVRKAKTDDKVEARVTMDMLAHGKVVIPRGAKIIGHITDAKAGTKEAPASTVEIAFDRVVLKHGGEIPLKATIQALGAPLQLSGTSSDGITDASSGMPPLGGGLPDTMGGAGRTGTPGYPPRPVGSGAGAGLDNGPNRNSAPPLGPTSIGVVGMKGISLASTAQGSTISSANENVHLGSGTQLILKVVEQ